MFQMFLWMRNINAGMKAAQFQPEREIITVSNIYLSITESIYWLLYTCRCNMLKHTYCLPPKSRILIPFPKEVLLFGLYYWRKQLLWFSWNVVVVSNRLGAVPMPLTLHSLCLDYWTTSPTFLRLGGVDHGPRKDPLGSAGEGPLASLVQAICGLHSEWPRQVFNVSDGVYFPALSAWQRLLENSHSGLYSVVWETVKIRLKTEKWLTGQVQNRELPGALCSRMYLAASHHTWSLHQSPEAGSQNTHSWQAFLVSPLSRKHHGSSLL